MTENRPPTLREVADVVEHGSRLIAEQMGKVAKAWSESMHRFWQTPDGQLLAALVKHYDEHPEELERLREANRPRQMCDCFCGRWNHRGVCATYGETTVPISSPVTGLVQVPMCGPCAADVRASAMPS